MPGSRGEGGTVGVRPEAAVKAKLLIAQSREKKGITKGDPTQALKAKLVFYKGQWQIKQADPASMPAGIILPV